MSDSTKSSQLDSATGRGAGELGSWERIWRFVTVLNLAVRVYAGYKSIQLWSRWVSKAKAAERYRRQDLRSARALLRTAVKLEGLLIKACQFIATRADVLPEEWVSTLSVLHDHVPPRSFEMIRAQVERELGRPLDAIFTAFNRQPIASASLAQVHEARLGDGRRCAVKVQYPGIEARVHADLRNLMFVLRILAWMESNFDFRVVAREMLKYVPMELDFVNEGRNCEQIGRNFATRADVLVPKVYWEFTSRRVLTMEFMEGLKITELEGTGINRHDVAQKLVEVYCEQILRDGFFQADPHPGNILVQPGPKLVLLDFGLAKDFPPSFRDGIVRLTLAMLTSDQAGIVRAFGELGFKTRDGSLEGMVKVSDLLVGNVVKRGKAYADQDLMQEISDELPRALRDNPIVEVPGDILLVSRVMGLLSGLGKSLDSKVDMMQTMMPYALLGTATKSRASGE
ncbi:MAG TPA: AarF/UbiB family protein [Candidatus Binataceae bacterium]|nr:AarF/UbiB family protein [Candidatus Binataceae bacterium]